MSVTLTQAMEDLSYLLGETSVPTTGVEDRQRFIQVALERAYRAYNFPFSNVNATVAVVSGIATLPTDIGQDTFLDVRDRTISPNIVYKQIDYTEYDRYNQGDYVYYLDGYEDTYTLNTKEANTTLTVRYGLTAPAINASVSTPFPSSMALARGALIYLRQAEDPQADISQEEALFQAELDDIIAAYNRNRPRRRMVSAHEASRTFIGDTGDND